MAIKEWDRFTVRINVDAPVEELYAAWATRAGIEHWFLRLSEYKAPDGTIRGNNELVSKGDTYKWLWYGYDDDTVENGTILDCNQRDMIKFSFGKAGNCSVRIYAEKDETIVELVQEQIPTDEESMQYYHVGCKTGWTFYMANLKSMYEGGIDLRNKNVELQNMLNA